MADVKQSNKPITLPYMQNRELSWLDFDKRVLDQGADPTVPLLERLNFVSIFWSNLQEFFMVRVGSLTDLSLIKKSIIDSKSGMTPAQQLDAVYARCHELYPSYEQTYEQLRDLLAAEGVEHLRSDGLNDEQRAFLDEYMHDNVMPFLSPQIVNARHPFPHLENGSLYIVVRLDEQTGAPDGKKGKGKGKDAKESKASKDGGDKAKPKDGKDPKANKAEKTEKAAAKEAKAAKNLGAEGVTLGLIPLPRQCQRIVQLPGKNFTFILLEHVIEMYAAEVFSMYKVKHTNVICVTRNADLDANEGADELGEDYRDHMKRILKKRSRLAPVRLESERELSSTVKPVLLERLNLKEHQLFVSSVPLDMSYTYALASRLAPKKRSRLTQAPFLPQWPACLERNRSIMEQVEKREVLMSYPYESMDPFVQLLREAASDPSVLSIKITLYRLASQSHLAEALIAAAENGKDVTALFELRARFDESNNIEWSQRFEQAGCHVIYGFRNFKVHSKICTITRQTDHGLQHVTQLGTGNYNEKTARLYTDFSFITADASIGRDAMNFFRNMALENTSDDYDILWVAPLQIKQNILANIDEQISRVRAGEPAGLFFKTNSVTDKDVIDKIVEASRAGVPTTLFVRGISCIVPGIEGYTDNVRVVSIVGRLLEHSRIYCFGPRENCKVYLSSADLMTRNMDKRIEIAWPILNEGLRAEVMAYLRTCMADTAKLRELKSDKSYTPLGYFAPLGQDGKPVLRNAQNQLIEEAQKRHRDAAEAAAALEANRFNPYAGSYVQMAPAEADEEAEVATLEAEKTGEAAAQAEHATGTTPEMARASEATATGAATPTSAPEPTGTPSPQPAEVVEAVIIEEEPPSAEEGQAGTGASRFSLTDEQKQQLRDTTRIAAANAAVAAKTAGTVAADVAKTTGTAAVKAARAAGSAAAEAAGTARENALARREQADENGSAKGGLLSRVLSIFRRR